MKRPKDVFRCDEELGRKLRECRLRVGLTQQKLATAMGRQGEGSHHVAGRLERGEVENPTIGMLADYLRACRASFGDILDVLDRHAAKLTPINVRPLGETDLIELSFYVRLKHKDRGDELINEPNRTPGVQYANLFCDEEQI